MGNSKGESDLGAESFARLLSLIDPDPERAGVKYEQLRERLIRFFALKGVASSEDLADEVIIRVVQKIEMVKELDNVNLFAYAIANNILREHWRRRLPQVDNPPAFAIPEKEDDDLESGPECLEQCLAQLPSEARELILRYYEGATPNRTTQSPY